MYQSIETVKSIMWDGEPVEPVASLQNENHGTQAHFIVVGDCYVLVHNNVATRSFEMAHGVFPEAMKVLRGLPPLEGEGNETRPEQDATRARMARERLWREKHMDHTKECKECLGEAHLEYGTMEWAEFRYGPGWEAGEHPNPAQIGQRTLADLFGRVVSGETRIEDVEVVGHRTQTEDGWKTGWAPTGKTTFTFQTFTKPLSAENARECMRCAKPFVGEAVFCGDDCSAKWAAGDSP